MVKSLMALRRRLAKTGVAVWLLAGAAYGQSPDGSELALPGAPPSLTTREGVWTWGPQEHSRPPGNYRILLNGHSAGGGIGSRLVVANGGQVYAYASGHWYLWSGRWQHQAQPPPLSPVTPPPPVTPPEPGEDTLRVPEAHGSIRSAVIVANAANSAKHYTIEIAAGTYIDEFVEVNRPMTMRAVGGPVILQATIPPTNGKALIVSNADLEVDGLTFTGVHNAQGNGAGIRDHNITADGKLTIRNSVFRENDTGVLTDNRSPDMTITVENTKFIDNGSPSIANPHALYVNSGKLLKITGSLFCGQLRGHNVKSRAAAIEITDSQLYDGAANPAVGCARTGSTSRAIDIANGGAAQIRRNEIIQGTGSPQFQMLSYGIEGLNYQVNTLVVTNNTFASPGTSHSTAIFDPHCIRNRPGSVIADNVFDHIGTIFNPATCAGG